jgi:mitochondrial fission protein ELM1
MSRPKLDLLLLREKRPGHFRQVEALAEIIGEMAEVTVDRLDVAPTRLENKHLRRLIAPLMKRDPIRWAERLYGLKLDQMKRPDVVLACARPTIAAGLLLAEHFGAKLIYVGRVSGFPHDAFDLILVHSPRYANDPHTAYSPIPVSVDRRKLRAPRIAQSREDLKGLDVSLLLGGITRQYQYTPDDWAKLARTVEEASAAGMRWRVSSSRRTPDEAVALFRALADRGVIAEFIDFKTAGPGTADSLYAADAIVLTEDSLSMCEEAASSGRPVIALKPPARSGDGSFSTEVIAAMVGEGALQVAPIDTFDLEMMARMLVGARVSEVDRPALVAKAVAPVLGLDLGLFRA